MNISIFGLGYVGAVTSACLARLGHVVIGVDPDHVKLDAINSGRSPILEHGLRELIVQGMASGRLSVTSDWNTAVAATDLSIICVGTPSQPNGGLHTDHVQRVAAQIGRAIRNRSRYHSVVVRSTVLPGTTDHIITPILERESGGKVNEAFGISMHPEFLREGTSIQDFFDPALIVIGAHTHAEYARVAAIYDTMKGAHNGETIQCPISTAEAIKYACNILHAVKITFANEIGALCKAANVDARIVMDIVCRDHKLNISAKYMKPGFAFGGSCLPKDLRAAVHFGRHSDTPLAMCEAVLASNRAQVERVAQWILASHTRRIAFMGVSFKEATDDLRDSPLVHLAELLHGRGCEVRIHDPNVHYAALFGSNKAFIDRELPHLKSMLVSAEEAMEHADLVVFGHDHECYRSLQAQLTPRHRVLDLANIAWKGGVPTQYEGLYW